MNDVCISRLRSVSGIGKLSNGLEKKAEEPTSLATCLRRYQHSAPTLFTNYLIFPYVIACKPELRWSFE